MTHHLTQFGDLSAHRRRLLVLAALVTGLTVALGAGAERAHALCSSPEPEAGAWVNADPNTRGIARIELVDCQPVTTCTGDVCQTVFDVGWRMRVWGKCSPTNCDWGWSAGARRNSAGQIPGFYDQGFARRYVYAKMSSYRRGQLWVHWRTDFVDPARADYSRDEWFVPA